MKRKIQIILVILATAISSTMVSALESPISDQDCVVYIYRAAPDKVVRGIPARYDVILNNTRISNLTEKTFVVLHLKPGSLILKIKSSYGTPTETLTLIANQTQYYKIQTYVNQKAIVLTEVTQAEAEKDLMGMVSRNVKVPNTMAFVAPKPGMRAAKPTQAPRVAEPSKATAPADTIGPEISILIPDTKRGLSVVATSHNQRVEGIAKDAKGIYEIQVNGIQAKIQTDGRFSVDVPLAVGENSLEVVARDTLMNETHKIFTVTRPADTIVAEKPQTAITQNNIGGRNYLLMIAINKYKFWPQLSNAVKDSKDMITVLTTRYQFSKTDVIEIYDEKATVDNIYNNFRELAGKLKEQDNLMIYFSGHGNYDKLLDEGFWIPVEARKNNNTDFLPNSTISKLIKAIPAKHTFLVADACFSGSLFTNGSRGYVENVEQYKSRWGLTSGRLEFVSDGRSGENSPFATYVLKFLRNNTKDVPVSELVQYVKTSVGNNSDQTPVGASLRNVGDEGGEFVFHPRK